MSFLTTEYEARRQVEVLEKGEEVEVETRWYDPLKKRTIPGRKKEDKLDYRSFPFLVVSSGIPPNNVYHSHCGMLTDRFFPEPDLPAIHLLPVPLSPIFAILTNKKEIESIRSLLPELPDQVLSRLVTEYDVSLSDGSLRSSFPVCT